MSDADKEFTALNREAWDSRASTYNAKPWQQTLASQVAEALQSHLDWLGANWSNGTNKCKLLDYACGTGNATNALSAHITSAVGMDISPQMLQQYSTLKLSHPDLDIQTAVADLVTSAPQPQVEGKEFFDFNIAVVALGFHHFADPKGCVQRLVQRLASGGVLCVVDWLPSDYTSERHGHHGSEKKEDTQEWKQMRKTIKQNGFEAQQMQDLFQAAGLTDFGFVVLEKRFLLNMNGGWVEKTGFLARGRKA